MDLRPQIFLRSVSSIKHLLKRRFIQVKAPANLDALVAPSRSMSTIDFNDHRSVAQTKSVKELVRALAILKVCSYSTLVNSAHTLSEKTRQLLGERAWTFLLKPMYTQFIGGGTKEGICDSVARLKTAAGLNPMIMVSLEEPTSLLTEPELCVLYSTNFKKLTSCIDYTADFNIAEPLMQVKPTGIFPSTLLEELSKIWHKETDSNPLGVPGRLIESLASIMNVGNLTKSLPNLESGHLRHLEAGIAMLNEICIQAAERGVRLLIDAEYTHINQGLSALTLAMSLNYNKVNRAQVWNTFQCYLKSAPNDFTREVAFMRDQGLAFGVKIVRGAYMVSEREYAQRHGRESPIHDNYEATNQCYDKVADLWFQEVAQRPDQVEGVLATHNVISLSRALQRIAELNRNKPANQTEGVSPIGPVFGQLYGMGDNLSIPLAAAGYKVYKSIPFGTLSDTLPYLIRRAQENRAVFDGIRAERTVLKKALREKCRL